MSHHRHGSRTSQKVPFISKQIYSMSCAFLWHASPWTALLTFTFGPGGSRSRAAAQKDDILDTKGTTMCRRLELDGQAAQFNHGGSLIPNILIHKKVTPEVNLPLVIINSGPGKHDGCTDATFTHSSSVSSDYTVTDHFIRGPSYVVSVVQATCARVMVGGIFSWHTLGQLCQPKYC
ncbi:hypothetical protein CHARACLAT_003750 [Characodon lateralis]|uniref:Uncharacterized protein n=1 Tax=Characodon lateralis TaxID=208331 RepID=A0ABU7CNC4_9TELE|nr:hypothetical protein [Characodon lateralis]